MQYTSRIILDNKLQMLGGMIYQDIHPIEGWETRECLYPEPLRFETLENWHPIGIGDHWKASYDHTRFFRARAKIPESFSGKRALLLLNVGGEAQVRVNGEIVSGVVSYLDGSFLSERLRTRVYLPEKYQMGDEIEIEAEACLNFLEFSYTTTMRAERPFAEYTFRQACFAVADEAIEKYYFDLLCAVEALDTFENPLDTFQNSNARVLNPTVRRVMEMLNGGSFMHKRLFAAAMDSASLLDLEFGYERLKASIPAASQALHEALAAIPHMPEGLVKFVGQSHIDTAWLWPLKESVRKCAKTFSNVLSLMERYPDFTFAFSQPQLFSYVEEYYPELFKQIRRRVAEGRIELVGNAWVEMDTNVPSGESLVRQLLYGRAYYLEKFGRASRVFWMPDVFGYSWALPQIMKRSGVDFFFTSKLVNNDTNNFPHSLFMWQGVDGTRILSYLQRLGYNGEYDAKTLSEIWSLYDQKDVCDTALMTIGYGDGGGGPSYQMLEKAQRLKTFPGLPESEFSTSVSFFEEAEKAEEKLPVWNDEMYYEFHRGTYTSQANVKKNNRKGEQLLRRAEIACSMAAALCGQPYPAREFAAVWKKLLTNQFHDILPGSSIHQVYDDCAAIYAEVFEKVEVLQNGAIRALNAALGVRKDQIAVWNFLSWPVTGMVQACLAGDWQGLTDERGKAAHCTAAKSGSGTAFLIEAENVPPMGVKIYTATARACEETRVTASACGLENGYLRVTLDENGNITSLYDKHARREVFAPDTLNNLLTVFEDIPHRESAWNIDMEYMNHTWPLDQAESVAVVEASAVRGVVRVVRKFNLSTITQDIVLAADSKRVEFITHVDWRETQRMLKAAFFPDVLSSKATYEIQFGAIERPTHWNTSYDRARFEVCGHKWADLSEGLYGVSLLNDCKYGYDILGSRMRLTLLRAPNYPDPTADKGEHTFTYAVYPHEGDWRVGGTVREGYELNAPLLATPGEGGGAALKPFDFVSTDAAHVVIDTIKGAEDGDGLILRVYESQGARGPVTLRPGFPAREALECSLMEENERPVPIEDGALRFRIRPYEIKTFRVRL